MSYVVTDITECSDETSSLLIEVNALRACIVLDRTGQKITRAVRQKQLKRGRVDFSRGVR